MLGLEAGTADGVDAVPDEGQSGPAEDGADAGDVAAERGVQGGQAGVRRGAEFELAAGFVGEAAPPAGRPGRGGVRVHQGADPSGGDVRGGIGGVDHEPLGLGADRPGRAGLEADPMNVLVDVVHGQPGHPRLLCSGNGFGSFPAEPHQISGDFHDLP
ncbi:hypothetical protein BJF79_11100 [Actinomadura sp. CNU-125]|nr:hypothetical protein BJF79_11100 [Actinomadura sp. CNU-125]